jgi:ribose 5-phosphate isomerase B
MSELWRVVVGADEAGRAYKDRIAEDLRSDPRVASVVDLGVFDAEVRPYPQVGIAAAQLIASGDADRAILICGTGIGMAISANKVPGVRATVVADSYSGERSVLSNDCQVMTMGERVVGLELARRLAREWLGYRFDPGSPSNDKVAEITEFERRRLS